MTIVYMTIKKKVNMTGERVDEASVHTTHRVVMVFAIKNNPD